MKNELLVFLISASPFVELRGAIPFGIATGVGVWKVFIIAILGNFIPIIPLLVFFKWAVTRLENMKGIGKLLKWWFKKVERKSKIVQLYGFWGLVLFVSIPFPGTGVWSGSIAATLLEFKLSRAFLAIFMGMVIAAILVTFG
ncbi:MAG: small multi-drug export protein, partial [Candidatus Omnitrophota bacterium]